MSFFYGKAMGTFKPKVKPCRACFCPLWTLCRPLLMRYPDEKGTPYSAWGVQGRMKLVWISSHYSSNSLFTIEHNKR